MIETLLSARKKMTLWIAFLGLSFSLTVSATSIKGADKIFLNPNSNVPSYVHFTGPEQPSLEGFEQWINLTFGLPGDFKLRFINSHKDEIGMEHFRYVQTYKGFPVNGSMLIVHSRNGLVESFNGDVSSEILSASTPLINFSTALSKATAHIGAKSFKWENPEEETFLKREQNNPDATFYPQNELRFVKTGKGEYKLAYRLDIYAHQPMSRNYVFVDAANGEIISVENRIHEANANGTAVTAYSGTQPIITDFTGSTYRLRETGRGLGIETYDMRLAGTNYSSAVDFTDADNNWNNVNANKDQYATDGHFGAEKTYDYFFQTHGRNSLNNAGLKLLSYVHTNLVAFGYGNNVNAFWDGTRMTYGDGNTTYTPLTTLDICGHEMTHGVTEFSANLVYSYESGALNEGFSDIFGTLVEFYANPATADWTVGEDIGAAFRSMSNPNAHNQPDTYLGTNWTTGSGDNGGVHTNSGVLNHWFYLLTVGGSGTNDIGNSFNVSGIGMTKSAAIAYRTLTTYLTTNSNYASARTFSIIAAEDLYGACSPEAIAVGNAWYAVGVGGNSSGSATITVGGPTTFCNGGSVLLTANTGPGITHQWNLNGTPISGAVSSTYTATQSGSYTVTTTTCGNNTTSAATVVTVNSVNAQINQSGPINSCAGDLVSLSATITPGYNIQWKRDGTPIPLATNTSYLASLPGNYTVTINAASFPQQVFNSSASTNIPDNSCTGASNNITISGYGTNVVNPAGISITVNLTHTFLGDLKLFLEAPNGNKIGLANGVGGSGDNFTNTVFSDLGATELPSTGAPYTGTYKPSSNLFTVCSNTMNRSTFASLGTTGFISPNGVWKLRAFDQAGSDVGVINSWSITIPAYTSPNPNCGPFTSSPVQVNFATPSTWYVDADNDGFGNPNFSMPACVQPFGFVADNTDCADNDFDVHTPQPFYVDADGDGFGSNTIEMVCASIAPGGYSDNNTDCDDNDFNLNTAQTYFVDADGDGFGSTTTALLCAATAPAGYSSNNTDCDDNNANLNTGQQYFVDADGDGFGSNTTALLCSATAPVGYSSNNSDCDDNNANLNTPQTYFVDADGDGFGSTNTAMLCSATAPVGYSSNNSDCNDNNANLNTPQTYFVDADGDGFGSNTTALLCASSAPAGYASNNTDCDDNNASINTPLPYYVDADGDGFGSAISSLLCASSAPVGYASNDTDCDDNNASLNTPQTFFVDADGDGFGSNISTLLCSTFPPTGYSGNNTDCDDNNASVNTPQSFFVDADGDGFGSTTTAMLCADSAPTGYSSNNTDCDDNNASLNAPLTYYVDADGDGFGSNTTALLCVATAPAGYSINNIDCDDNNASISMGQPYFVDADGDGFGSVFSTLLCASTAPAGYSNNSNDCDDSNANVSPLSIEICGNNIDDNCDGNVDENCGPSTQLRSSDCGKLTFNLQSSIVADAVAGATQYEFQFKDANDVSVVATRIQTSRTLAIANVNPALQWGTNYTVRVRPYIGTAIGTYGAPCTIGFVPDPNIFGIPSTQLVTSHCGKLNFLLASSITADVVAGATQYEFEFRNVSTNALVATKIQTNNFTTLSSVTPALQWGTQYNVSVRAYYGNIAGTFGPVCLIGLIPDPALSGVPNTQLSNASCNKTGLSLTGNITCVLVTGANQYEFEFTNPVGGALVALKTTTTATCALSSVSPALQWGTNYNVRVRAFIAGTGGVFSTICSIGIIPDPAVSGVPSTRLNSMNCGNQNLTLSSSIVALTVSGANQYEFEFSNPNTSAVVATKTTTSATCYLSSVSPALQWGTQYNVRVRAFIAGTAGTFGNACLIGLIPDPAIFGVPNTQLRAVDCGKLTFALNSNTAATPVSGATQYEFEFSDPNTSAVVATKLQTSATLSLASVTPALQAGTTYNVRVRAYINSFVGNYGNVCLIGFVSGSRFADEAEGNMESGDVVSRLAVYPNPYYCNTTLLFSTTLNESAMMNVYDMSGRLVEQKMIQTNTNVVLGENFERGVYLIQVTGNSGEQIHTRLIKN